MAQTAAQSLIEQGVRQRKPGNQRDQPSAATSIATSDNASTAAIAEWATGASARMNS